MTVDGNEIRCDAFGCHVRSKADFGIDFDDDELRLRYAILGWRSAGEKGESDFCPLHLPGSGLP
jgi:hypothetical protein